MKGMKKLLSILMVLTLVLSLSATAFAATVTIEDGAPNHQYVAYKVFKGTTATIDGVEKLASVEWADDVQSSALLDKLAEAFTGTFTPEMTPEEAANAMNTVDSKELARVLIENKALLASIGEVKNGTELAPGYYAIEDATDVDGEHDSKNAVVLEVVGDTVEINAKYDVPESQKKVQDINDSTEATKTDWQDSADWDIGDDVPFQFVGTLPSNLAEYKTYKMVFHDNQSAGLTFNNDVKVYLGTKSGDTYIKGTEITEGFEVVTPAKDGHTFDVVIEDVLSLKPTPTADNVIIVEYTSELNENAKLGKQGNPNTMGMEFSNNPSGEGTGKTPDDTVIVFTYNFDVNKVDENEEPLTGATFSLYKELETAVDGCVYLDANYNVVDADAEGATPYEKKELTVDGNVFSTKGLDDGNYVIVEDEAPDGYNKADPIPFTIYAEHDETSDDPDLTKLVVKDKDGNSLSEATTEEGATFDVTLTEEESNIATDVKNFSGLELPETGGIGTTIFYIAGAILVAGAVILLVTKKRVSGMEK